MALLIQKGGRIVAVGVHSLPYRVHLLAGSLEGQLMPG